MPAVGSRSGDLGHAVAGAGILETAVALCALRERIVPGIGTLAELDSDCADLPVSALPQTPRSDIALILSRGFAATNAALLVRAA